MWRNVSGWDDDENEEYKKYADLHLKGNGGEVFHVHKCVVLPQCDFNGALLQEDATSIVELDESDAAVEQLLGHLYGFEVGFEYSFMDNHDTDEDSHALVAVQVWIAAKKVRAE